MTNAHLSTHARDRVTRPLAAALVAVFGLAAVSANAAPLTLEGDYIRVGISDYGTLGSGGATSPGLLHDPTGTSTFGVNDYITPGTPHEGFSLVSDQFSFSQNDNDGFSDFGTASPTLLVGPDALGYANAATWSGGNAFLSITNSYFFNPGDQRILVTTKITALSDLADLAFARSVDPDPDVNTFGSFSTNNQRGNLLFGVDDFIGAEGPSTGLTLAIVNLNGDVYVHGTQINGSCCSNIDPYDVLAFPGGVTSVGDHGLNMAWRIGDLTTGSIATINYAYAVGDRIGTVGGDGGVIPEPASWLMMIAGFGLVGAALRRRRLAIA